MSRGRHEKPTFLVVPVLEGINAKLHPKLHPMPQPMPDPGTEVCPIWRVMKRRQGSFRAFAIKDPFLKRSMKCGEKNYNLFEFKQLLGFLFLRTCLEVLGDKLSTDGGTDRRTD